MQDASADTPLESRPCPVCDDVAGTPVVSFPTGVYDRTRYETASWDGRLDVAMHIIRCDCGLVRTEPAFREDRLDHVYPEDLVDVDALRRDVDRVFEAGNKKYNAMARHTRRFLPAGAVLVDVGSRYGVFPWIAETRHELSAFGVELNAAAVAVGRERFDKLLHGTIAELPDRLAERGVDHVDGFVLDDVLEHLPHVGRDLATLAALQRPGGFLFLRQMDHAGLSRRVFGKRWYYYQPAAHMFYFDRASVAALLDRYGYDIVDVDRAHPAYNAVRTAARLPKAFWKRFKARRAAPDARPSYLTQRFRGYDDMFLVTARKRGA